MDPQRSSLLLCISLSDLNKEHSVHIGWQKNLTTLPEKHVVPIN